MALASGQNFTSSILKRHLKNSTHHISYGIYIFHMVFTYFTWYSHISFGVLSAIKTTDVDDVREVLSYYRTHEDPIEAFRSNQRRLQEEMAAEAQVKKEKPLVSGMSFLRRR